jgi:uncharacterized protein (UPF0264 family)
MSRNMLLVSVRGKNDAIEAVAGGAHIIDAENPSTSLGTAYPLNIHTIRKHTPSALPVSTNIGEKQFIWSTAAQAALGVALAGADIIKVGLASLSPPKASKIMRDIVRHVHHWYPEKILIPTFFADDDLREILDPVVEGAGVCRSAKAHGVLIDTFNKKTSKGLLDYLTLPEVKRFVKSCHSSGQEAWVAGSLERRQLPALWKTGVDVICVRKAACEEGRLGKVSRRLVRELVNTIA